LGRTDRGPRGHFFLAALLAGCGGHASADDLRPGFADAGDAPSVEPDAAVVEDASVVSDAPVIRFGDAIAVDACDIGSAASFATNQTLDIFGRPTYYADGGSLPPGHYRVAYVDGCMKYSAAQDWAVNAYQGDPDSWWLVGATTADRILVPPGTVGFLVGAGGFATFDDCVAANHEVPPLEFQFDGGPLGVWLQDNPYSDNVAGVNGRNPRWDLALLGDCSSIMIH
jgi:hypothetical protein